jgi:hypothetical protein
MKQQGTWWSAERLKDRAAVDALRAVLGLDPLYNQKRPRQYTWLNDVRDAYYDSGVVKRLGLPRAG